MKSLASDHFIVLGACTPHFKHVCYRVGKENMEKEGCSADRAEDTSHGKARTANQDSG